MTTPTQENEALLEHEETQYWVGLHQSLERLHDNPDFQKVVLDAYFKDRAVNGTSMLASEYVVQNGKRSEIMEDLVAISRLQHFFMMIENLGSIPDEEEDDQEG